MPDTKTDGPGRAPRPRSPEPSVTPPRPPGSAERQGIRHRTATPYPLAGPDADAGPLDVSEANPRYVTVASGNAADRRAVYLTGSHIRNKFHAGLGPGASCAETSEQVDYGASLGFLKDHGHNFIRLQGWE